MPQADLANLHDIISAPPVSWWPPAQGWYMLVTIVLVGLSWYVWSWLCYRKLNAYRRVSLIQLKLLELQLKDVGQCEASLRALPELVKRTALAAWPREEVAGLSGESWLSWLDHSWQGQSFTNGVGLLLPQLAYVDTDTLNSLTATEIDDLVHLIRNWIRLHHRPQHTERRA